MPVGGGVICRPVIAERGLSGTSHLVGLTVEYVPVGGGVICRHVIAERGLSGASHLVGLTVEGWHSQTTCTAMPGKLWFSRNRGTNMTTNVHFRIEKACRGYPLRLGTFSTFGSWRPSGFCSSYKCLHGP